MIILDTHIWVWWVHGDARLPGLLPDVCGEARDPRPRGECHLLLGSRQVSGVWSSHAPLSHYGVARPGTGVSWHPFARELTPRIIVESTQLPGTFHRDPADQLIVATARVYHCPFVTVDTKILAYPHVQNEP